jgi:hypothetical protein
MPKETDHGAHGVLRDVDANQNADDEVIDMNES